MAHVSLDDLRVEVPLVLPLEQALQKLERVAWDLAEGRFADWRVTLSRLPDSLNLIAYRNGTEFNATLRPTGTLAILEIRGEAKINRLKLTLAGGPRGLRKLIRGRLDRELRALLS